MFSSPAHLKRRTPANGINRREFIAHLVEEYHTTFDIEAQEQVTANLANFAYDPINWKFLKESETLQLFLEVIGSPNERLQLHGIAGLCNICLDTQALEFISNPTNSSLITKYFLKTQNLEILINCVTLFYQLLSATESQDIKQRFTFPDILRKINDFRAGDYDQRIKNIATVFLEDFGTRTEIIDIKTKVKSTESESNPKS